VKERYKLVLIVAVVAAFWFLPVGSSRLWGTVQESVSLAHWYAREHVLLCLIPVFFIAGAVAVFVSRGAVMKHLGPQANPLVAYPVGAVLFAVVIGLLMQPIFRKEEKA
jgi:uncharacterized membrane protein YraQ (UPF0718 family)